MVDVVEPRLRLRWPSLFQENAKPLFVLNRARRLKFVNAAWEKLTGEVSSDVLGKACLRKGPTEPLYRSLAPPGELTMRSVATVRRPAPPQENGPPWWDVTFVKLTDVEGSIGYLGLIEIVASIPTEPAKSCSPFIGTLRKKHSEQFTFDLFAGPSLAAERLLSQLHNAAATAAPVWIHGERGSGKETAARVIHHNGARREQPFVKIDCAALEPYLIEAILFGTSGLALGDRIGTLYLKNPAALPRDLQQKLSNWLMHAKAPRVISSSLKTATDEAALGMLRPEYATALAVLEIVPLPLRSRLDDLPRIVERLLLRHSMKPASIEDQFFKVLRSHQWPGNLGELRDALVTTAFESGPLTAAHLPRYLREKSLGPETTPKVPRPSLDAILEAVEKKLIAKALADCNGNQTEAAQRLGIFRARIIRRIEALGLE